MLYCFIIQIALKENLLFFQVSVAAALWLELWWAIPNKEIYIFLRRVRALQSFSKLGVIPNMVICCFDSHFSGGVISRSELVCLVGIPTKGKSHDFLI